MRKTLSALLAAVLMLTAAPLQIFAQGTLPLPIAAVSDIHYFPAELTGDYCQAFLDYCENNTRQVGQSVVLLESALDAVSKHAAEKGIKYLLIAGDNTNDGEYEAHRILAARLERFEQDTGIQVIVTNGNHDINNAGATTFESGAKAKARTTSPEDFLDLYKNLGYDIAYHTYTPPEGKKAGMLSYSVRLEGGYRLIVMDCEKYSADITSDGEDQHEGEGVCTPALMEWVLAECADAAACGEKVIGMTHHSVTEHFGIEASVMPTLILDNWLETSEALAGTGMRYVFTGHTHMNDTATGTNDNGETITDIMLASLTGYPNTYKEVTFSRSGDTFSAAIETLDPDCTLPVTYLGTTYAYPYRNTFGFWQSFGQNGLKQWGTDMVYQTVSKYLQDFINKGLSEVLRENGFDPGDSAFSDVLDSLTEQLQNTYLNDPDRVYAVIDKALTRVGCLQISDCSCTKFIDTVGFGDASRGGNFEEFGMSLLVYLYNGDEYLDDDPFMADVLTKFQSGEMTSLLLSTLSSVIVDDLLLDGIPSLVLPAGFTDMKTTLTDAVEILLLAALGEEIDPAYFTGSKALGAALSVYAAGSGLSGDLAYWIESLITDSNPGVKMDNTAHLDYTSPIAVEATAVNGRLPSQIAVTGTENNSTEKTVSWLTKYSVTGSDIEILTDSAANFTGIPSKDYVVSQTGDPVQNEYYALHLAPGTGIFSYKLNEIQHSVTLTDLLPNTVYRFRVGNAEKGWWSEEYTLNTYTDTGVDYATIAELTTFFGRLSAILKIVKTL